MRFALNARPPASQGSAPDGPKNANHPTPHKGPKWSTFAPPWWFPFTPPLTQSATLPCWCSVGVLVLLNRSRRSARLRLVADDHVAPEEPRGRSARGEPFKRAEIELATIAKALSHPVRVRIVRLLVARGGLRSGEIAAAFPLAQSTVSEHLRVLRESGLVNIDADGLRSIHTVDIRVLRVLQARVVEL